VAIVKMKMLFVAKEGESTYLTPEEVARCLGFRYLPRLDFQENYLEKRVRRDVEKAVSKGRLKRRDKWLGALFKRELG